MFRAFLTERGIYMEIMNNPSTLEEMMIQQAKQFNTPITGSIELLPLCNMNCDMCYVRLSRQEMEKVGHLRSAEEWLAIAQQMQKAGVLFLLLTGGEPLLFPEFKQLYLALRQMGMIITINTNATLIDQEWAAFFGQYKPRRVNVTLYGEDEKAYEELCHYPEGFNRTMRAIQLLKEQNVDVKISCSLTKTNCHSLERIFEIGRKYRVPVHVDPYMMPGIRERNRPFNQHIRVLPEIAAKASLDALKIQLSEEYYRQYIIQSIEKVHHADASIGDGHISCLAGRCSFTINWQGEMRPCVMMTEPSVPVFERGFENAWKEICSQTQNIRISAVCRQCHLRPLCKICAAASLLETGQYDGVPDYLCRYAKELYRLILLEEKKYE